MKDDQNINGQRMDGYMYGLRIDAWRIDVHKMDGRLTGVLVRSYIYTHVVSAYGIEVTIRHFILTVPSSNPPEPF